MNTTVFGSPSLVSVENQVKGLIAAAEANIERLTTQIRELSLLREKERSILAALRLMVAPIGKLPTELLVEIFKLVADGASFNPIYYFKNEARAALRSVLCLSQVSPYWRQIVHNAPKLWTRNFIEICVDRESEDHYLDEIETFLARSNPLPISIAFVLSAKTSSYSQLSKTIARIVTPTAHRWKKLNINMPSLCSFNEIPPGTFDALEYLCLDDLQDQTDPVVAFRSSPRLHTFAFFSVGVSNVHLLCLPWSQLVRLTISDTSPKGCRAVLLQCSQLISATFTTSYKWDSLDPVATELPVITLPFLDQLSLTLSEVGTNMPHEIHSVEAFLVPLALPSLKTLELDFEDFESALWPTQAVLIDRCPNIEKITLHDSSISSEALVALLRHGRTLTTLGLTNCWNCIDQRFWHALRYDVADPTPLAPKLKNLYLECVGDGFKDRTMETAIRSRWWLDDGGSAGSRPRISRLESVSVSRFGDIDSDEEVEVFSEQFTAQMQDMVDQGLDLSLW